MGTVFQLGTTNLLIERNNGEIYMQGYVANTSRAFQEESFELDHYCPSIHPSIQREEVQEILDWIFFPEEDVKDSQRIALLYGKPGIGKSVVMHDVFERLKDKNNIEVLGLKSDQIEFADTADLAKQMNLAKPLTDVIKELAITSKRVVLLIDQIDALSLSLSSNRTPLRSLLKLIDQLKAIPNIRILISCRPYDLEYDPVLEQLRPPTKWELKGFKVDDVKKILGANKYSRKLSDKMLDFLGNPLYLHLFLKVKDKITDVDYLTEQSLYSSLWNMYIKDIKSHDVNINDVIHSLDHIVQNMYHNQMLTISLNILPTEDNNAIQYLLSSEIIIEPQEGKIQFFHQTLFDYIYARRFVEKNMDLLKELKSSHQGLFIRSTVKSILIYERAYNQTKYSTYIRGLIMDKDSFGRYVYRYHLQMLAVTLIAFYDKPIQQEIVLIRDVLFGERKELMKALFDAVSTYDWFVAIKDIIFCKGGWNSLSKEYKECWIEVCRRLLWNHGVEILDYIISIFKEKHTEEDEKLIASIFSAFEINCDSSRLIPIYKHFSKSPTFLIQVPLLRNILKTNPQFVAEELKANILTQLKEGKKRSGISLAHDMETVYTAFKNEYPSLYFNFSIKLLEFIFEKTKYKLMDNAISDSWEFIHFERIRNPILTMDMNFTSNLLSEVLDSIEKEMDENEEKIDEFLNKLAQSNLGGIVYIAICGYAHNPQKYASVIYDFLITRPILVDAPLLVEYQSRELLKAAFNYLTIDQQNKIVNFIMEVSPKCEKRMFDKNHMQYNLPITQIGRSKGELLGLIDCNILKKKYFLAYQEYLRQERKFKCLENKRPFESSSFYGWPQLSKEKTKRMNDSAWLKSMRKYNTDGNVGWSTPSLTGQKMQFREAVKSNPQRFMPLIAKVINDNNIPLDYATAGFSGLVDANRFEDAEHIFAMIVDTLGGDINYPSRNCSIYELLIASNELIDKGKFPRIIFDFICNVALYANDNQEYNPHDVEIYQTAINQLRGNAVFILVNSSSHLEYGNEILNVLEKISKKSSVYTRAAALLNMALLNNIDKKRSVHIFVNMMYDYFPPLLAMPVHNLNPLIYYVDYAFDELIPFFKHCMNEQSCYKQQVIILWLAWYKKNYPKSEELLDQMLEKSEEARISLIQFLSRQLSIIDCDKGLVYIRFLADNRFASEKLANAFDTIFHDINKWPDNKKQELSDLFLNSNLSKYKVRSYYEFLAGFAISHPIESLGALEQLKMKYTPGDVFADNKMADILIQAYNGVRSFSNDSDILEKAMDLMDSLLKSQQQKYRMNYFFYKLDNE